MLFTRLALPNEELSAMVDLRFTNVLYAMLMGYAWSLGNSIR